MNVPSVGGAVLAGGRSERMGRDKAMIPVGGEPMAARVVAALRDAGCADVVLVGGEARLLDVVTVADEHPSEGPLGGVLTALGASDADVVVVAACDLPWLDAGTVRSVLAGLSGRGEAADVAFARTDRMEPLCGAWRRSACRPVLAAAFAAGERAIHRAVAGLRVVEIPVEPRALTNVNTPGELRALDSDGWGSYR